MPDSEMLAKICFEVRESSKVNDQTVRGSFSVANYGNYCVSLSLGVRLGKPKASLAGGS